MNNSLLMPFRAHQKRHHLAQTVTGGFHGERYGKEREFNPQLDVTDYMPSQMSRFAPEGETFRTIQYVQQTGHEHAYPVHGSDADSGRSTGLSKDRPSSGARVDEEFVVERKHPHCDRLQNRIELDDGQIMIKPLELRDEEEREKQGFGKGK